MHVQDVGLQGGHTVDRFDAEIGSVGTNVTRMSSTLNARMSASFPPWLLIAFACVLGIFLLLGIVWLIGTLAEKAFGGEIENATKRRKAVTTTTKRQRADQQRQQRQQRQIHQI